ncbi:MAG: CHASE2 domain-containing protein, partial [Microcystaceae cyanobacterium]
MKSKNKLVANWGKVLLAGIPLTGLILAFRFMGWLQPLEWAAYDVFFQLRPLELTDKRIVIVGLEEPEVKLYPISDRTLANLLEKIKAQQP